MPEIKTKICPICKNGFIKPLNYTPSRWARKMHCSQNCWHQYLRLIHKGKKLSMGMIEKLRKINMGNKYNLGRKNGSPSLETKRKISLALLGKPGHLQTEETRKKISFALQGEKHYKWIKDRTLLKRREVKDGSLYKQWRKTILERDDYRCMDCGEIKKGKMEADHIYSWAKFPRLRYEVENGQTLCQNCHRIKTNFELRKNANVIFAISY